MNPTTKDSQDCTLILVKGINTSRTDKVVMCGTGVTAVVGDAVLELAGMIEVKR